MANSSQRLLLAVMTCAMLTLSSCVYPDAAQPDPPSRSIETPRQTVAPTPGVDPTPLPQPASTSPIQRDDLGVQDGASGASSDSDGTTVYIVVSGDNASGIAARFDVELDQLTDVDGRRLGHYPTLQVGDRIRFAEALTGYERDCFYELLDSVDDLQDCRAHFRS